MNPEYRKGVGRYLSEVKDARESWTETRMAVNWNGSIFIITNNFPHWTATQLLDFFTSQGLKPFDLEVIVTPNLTMNAVAAPKPEVKFSDGT